MSSERNELRSTQNKNGSRLKSEFGHAVRIGPAGWSYADWEGTVYPPHRSKFDHLAYLASFFDTIEINSPFYRIPPPAHARSWVRRVAANPDFRFTTKIFRGFTHEAQAPGPGDVDAFKAYLDPLADKALLVSIYVALGVNDYIPRWLVILVVSRDILIVGGVMLSWLVGSPVKVKPLLVSKLNTVAQIVFACVVLGSLGFHIEAKNLTLALMALVAPLRERVLVHIDLHETTNSDESEFRPALAARDGKPFEPEAIPDGFYLCADAANPQPEFQQAVIAAVAKVTHIAPADAKGEIIGSPVVAPGVIEYDYARLGLCPRITNARYKTTTEVYPDSPRATPEQCNAAQVAAVRAALDFILAQVPG